MVQSTHERKFKEDLIGVYNFFCKHVAKSRPILANNIEKIATGEHWHGIEALDLKLVDELKTSEEYILENIKNAEFVKVAFKGEPRSFVEKLSSNFARTFVETVITTAVNVAYKTVYNLSLYK